MYGFFSEADELPYAGLDAVQGLYDIAIEGEIGRASCRERV